MLRAKLKVLPSKQSSTGHKTWWNRELKLVRKNTRKLNNKARSDKRFENWANYRRRFNEYKKEIEKEKWETMDICVLGFPI